MRSPLRAALGLVALLLAGGCGLWSDPDTFQAPITGCPAYDFAGASAQARPGALRPRAAPAPSSDAAFVPGRVIVRYHDATGVRPQGPAHGREVAAAVRRDHGATRARTLRPGTELVRVRGDTVAAARALHDDPRVRYAHPDYLLTPQAAPPNDPHFPDQWALTGFGLPQAWELEPGSADVVVAVIDNGFAVTHEDLAGRLNPGYDFAEGDDDVTLASIPEEQRGDAAHGSHVAAIAAADTDNGVGIAGVARSGVRLLPIKVFGQLDNGQPGFRTSAVAQGIDWASGASVETEGGTVPAPDAPAAIINISLGASGTIEVLNEAIERAAARGAIVVAAAGNAGSGTASTGILSPASAPCAIAVGSVGRGGERDGFSRFDADALAIDVMAPGGAGPCRTGESGIVSAGYEADAYACKSGTSMASPFVAGVLALLRAQEPEAPPERLIVRLLGEAHFGGAMTREAYGAGIACADAALGAHTRCAGAAFR